MLATFNTNIDTSFLFSYTFFPLKKWFKHNLFYYSMLYVIINNTSIFLGSVSLKESYYPINFDKVK